MAVLRSVTTKKVLLPILRYFSVALMVFSVFSVPIIINDVLRQGENTRNFFEALTSKPDGKHSLVEKFSEALYQNGRYLCLVSTGTCISGKIEKIALPLTVTTLFLFASLCALIARLRSTKSDAERDFLRLTLVWLIVFFILSVPVAFQLRPRFFLVVIAIPFFLWAILFEYLRDRWSHRGALIGLTVFALLLGLNIYGTAMWFQEQSLSQEKGISIERTLILKNKDGVTLGQLKRASEVLAKAVRKDERIYFFVKPEHIAPVEYLLRQERRRNPALVFENMEKWNDRFEQDPKARFFALVNVEHVHLDAIAKKFEKSIEVLSVEPCGQIAAVEFRVLNRIIDSSFQQEIQHQKLITEKKPGGRVFWGDVFGFETASSMSDEVENEDAAISEE